MPSYQLPAARRGPVVRGEQTFALQLPRKASSPRHVRLGETMTLRIDAQSFPAKCVARALIHMDRDGIRRVLDQAISLYALDAGHAINRRVVNAENGSATAEASRDALARELGHDDYAALWRYEFGREDGRGKVSRGVIAREVIGWVSAEVEA